MATRLHSSFAGCLERDSRNDYLRPIGLERGLMGQASERLRRPNEAQMSFDMLSAMIGEREKAEIGSLVAEHSQEIVREHKRNPTGRRPLTEDLPRVDIEILPDEVVQQGLSAFEKIGEEVTEILEHRPASLVVARIINPKVVRNDRDKSKVQVMVGATPPMCNWHMQLVDMAEPLIAAMGSDAFAQRSGVRRELV